MSNFITHTIEPWMPPGALKAKADYAHIADQSGWTVLPLARYNDARYDDATRTQFINSWLQQVNTNDIVLHQFPSYMSEKFEVQFAKTLKARQVKRAILIHDIEPLRLMKHPIWDFDLFNLYDVVIVHSQAMKVQLQSLGITSQFIIQPLFDYLGLSYSLVSFSHEINFAGTFQKSPWLQQAQNVHINLFGAKPKKWRDTTFPANVTYKGNLDPEQLIMAFRDGFGLIWDNDFEDKTYKTYTKYNAPHKASLYIRAGLPLIAWHESAIGQIIAEQEIGFVIDKLNQLPAQLSETTAAQFNLWQQNMQPLAQQLASGYFTKATLAQLTQ